MQKKKIKEYLLGGIALFIVLFTLIGMAFNLTQMKNYREYEKSVPYTYHDNGFNLLDFDSDLVGREYDWVPKLLGAFSLIQLLACIAATVLVVLSFIAAKKRKNILNAIAVIIGAFFSLLYMIEGVTYTAVFNDEIGGKYFETLSFVPLIIVVVAVVAYILVAKLFVVEAESGVNSKQETSNTAETYVKKVDVVQIKQLKELLDMGAITQEEYDEKKKEILNG